jgi:predicted 3-demethylubiquinone-9 3-methyltransferase (glyoxalase superfamily)
MRNKNKKKTTLKRRGPVTRISPFLWFDKEAGEAANLYTSLFKGSKIIKKTRLDHTPSGTVEIVSTLLAGQEFTLMSAGPFFKFNPSVSFLVTGKTKDEVDALWTKLIDGGGKSLMELGVYPFSERYGWLQDKYGLSWQVILLPNRNGQKKQRIIPTLMFVGSVYGKAEQAMQYYTSIFKNSKVGYIARYSKEQGPDHEGMIMHGSFRLGGYEFAAMDSAREHNFGFNEAVSFVVNCKTQSEIDYYWEKLSFDPKAEQCGWLKDKYGLSWQIVPSILPELLQDKNKEKVRRVTDAFLKMKKLDIDALKQAYRGGNK